MPEVFQDQYEEHFSRDGMYHLPPHTPISILDRLAHAYTTLTSDASRRYESMSKVPNKLPYAKNFSLFN